ncbi:outer membrane lipoprotein-sorting protein [Desulfuromonas thiophila]|uniref:outer membrane lipoprotein-sorting protein n=1 Tax=Desulfuromonas thiophila TaxID=57664 RepID=UPI0024A800EB|nr:outer membrane lipoprotein-sorting protein [Desulfuromonas thiophila]
MHPRFWCVVVLLLLVPAPLLALDAQEIVERANQAAYYAGADGRARVEMTIRDASGLERQRRFTLLRRNEADGRQRFYAYFEAPADVNKMAYLVWKNPAAEDDRWLWLPALNLVKRIAPGDKRTSFVGSDFLYEDVSGRSTREDTHVLLEETDSHYVIESRPKNPASVEFGRFVTRIDKQTFLPLKADYYDSSDRLYRQVEALQVETIQGFATVTHAVARDLLRDSSTENRFSGVVYDLGLNERIFTERFLRRPPREVLH